MEEALGMRNCLEYIGWVKILVAYGTSASNTIPMSMKSHRDEARYIC